MDGISHIRTTQCHVHFQSRVVHKTTCNYFNVIFRTMSQTLYYSITHLELK